MPQIRNYTQALSLEGTDAFVIDRLGGGTFYIEAIDFVPTQGDTLISASGANLAAGLAYAVRTNLGAFSGTLPQLSTVTPGNYLEVADADDNAGSNHYTVNAFAGDEISDHATLGTAYIINVSNTITRFIANTAAWRAITYGM